jgi:hypothetical protein
VSEGTTANKQTTKFLNRPVLTQFPIRKKREARTENVNYKEATKAV